MQGVPVLVINDDYTVEHVPCCPPENNSISITETFEGIESDWLSGTFHIRAAGNSARHIDENLKWLTLQETGFVRSSQIALNNYMPQISVKSYDRISHTANSDIFEILGTHSRCRLTFNNSHYLGILTWSDPYIPLNFWRSLKLKGYFTFPCPHLIEITVMLQGDLAERYAGYNNPVNYRSDLCDIFETVENNGDGISISRKIVIKEKFIKEDLIDQFPAAMENAEKAFQLPMILSR
jgi:hypothetical protein